MRRILARRAAYIMAVVWAILFVALESPLLLVSSRSRLTLLPFALLALLLGSHLIIFCREDSEYFSGSRAAIGLETESQNPVAMATAGLMALAFGGVFIYLI